ncbi:hypothetical protein RJ641_028737 [Dillenia turbinata]|uniref:Uncharacterized protein n=1 Tax=Dillenia turbinata TaxID=194707 RepID=A0AAN8W0J9_9MAGN
MERVMGSAGLESQRPWLLVVLALKGGLCSIQFRIHRQIRQENTLTITKQSHLASPTITCLGEAQQEDHSSSTGSS